MNQGLIQFSFQNQQVRIVSIDGEPWFVAKDVCEVLDMYWDGARTISHVPEQWRGSTLVPTPRGQQEMAVLSEHGLYFFLNRSDKEKALPFQLKVKEKSSPPSARPAPTQ